MGLDGIINNTGVWRMDNKCMWMENVRCGAMER